MRGNKTKHARKPPLCKGRPGGAYNQQPYGDLTLLNKGRLILEGVGREALTDIVMDYLDLLGTSAAVYEKNGDYALGLFTSGWCRLLDRASRALCNTGDNAVALRSGLWHCHESCWSEVSRVALESRGPVEQECRGGLRIYAVPIFCDGEVVGAMNFGHGKPPGTAKKLREVAERYKVDFQELCALARSCEAPPKSHIEITKKRLEGSAKLIGEILKGRRAEAALRKSEQRLEAMLQTMVDGVLMVDLGGSITYANHGAQRILGLPREEAVGRPYSSGEGQEWDEYGRPLSLDQLPLAVALREKRTVAGVEHTVLARDGERRWLSVNAAPLLDEAGQLYGALASFQDITARRRAEEGLRINELRFRALAYLSPVGIFQTDREGRCLYVNEGWSRLTGLAEEEALGDLWVQSFHPEDRERVLEGWHACCVEGRAFHHEFRLMRPDGQIRWVLGQSSVLPGAEGEALGYVGTLTDFTDQKARVLGTLRQDALIRLALMHHEPLRETAEFVMDTALRLTDSEYGFIYLLTPEGESFNPLAYSATVKRACQGQRSDQIPRDEGGLLERALARKSPLVINDYAAASTGTTGLPEGPVALKRVVLVPVMDSDRPALLLAVGNKEEDYQEDDVRHLRLLAEGLGMQIKVRSKEAALRESDEDLSAIMRTSAEAILITDLEGRVLSANSAAATALGGRAEKLAGAPDFGTCEPGALAKLREAAAEAIKARGVVKYRVTLGARSYDHNVYPVLGEGGAVIRLVVMARDITEQMLAEEALRQREERFRGMFEEHAAVMVLIDPASKSIVWANRAAQALYGHRQEGLEGRSLASLLVVGNVGDSDPVAKFDLGRASLFELRHRLADGSVRDVEVHASPLVFRHQKLLFCVLHDITDRKLAEAAQKKLSSLLTERVKELHCLYGIAKTMESPDLTLAGMLQRTVEIMPSGWQFPELVCTRVSVEGVGEFRSADYAETSLATSVPVLLQGEAVGLVAVCCKEDVPHARGLFLEEERELIKSIAGLVGRAVERSRYMEALKGANLTLDLKVRARTLELAQTNELLGSVLESTSDIVYVKDLRGRYILGNSSFGALLGMPMAEVVGRTDGDLFPPEIAARFAEGDAKVLDTGSGLVQEIGLGPRVYFERKDVYHGPKGEAAGIMGIATDITDIKRVQRELASSREQLSRIFELSMDLICIATRDRFIRVNPAFTRTLGYCEAELYDRPYGEFLHPEDLDRTRRLVEEKLGRGLAVVDLTNRYRRKDGTYVWLEWIISPLDTTGHLYAVARDITERIRSEEALRGAHELLERVFDTTHMLMAYLDVEFRFLRVNRAYAEADGHGPEWFVGKNHFDLYPNPENEALFRKVARSGEPYNVQAKSFEYPDNPERGMTYWDWSLTPVKNASGKVEGLLFSLLDVTERVQAEEAVLEAAHLDIFMAAMSRQVMASTEFKEIAGEVVKFACMVTESPVGFASIINPENGNHESYSYTNREAGQFPLGSWGEMVSHPSGRDGKYGDLWGHALNSREGFFTNSPSTHPAGKGLPEGHAPLGCFMAAPAFSEDTPLGQVAVADRPGGYKDSHLAALKRIAEVFGLAVLRHLAERALRESHENILALLNAPPDDAIYILDTGLAFVDLNQALAERFGREVEEVRGMHFGDFLPPELLRTRSAHLEEAARTGALVRFEDVHAGRFLENSVYPVFGSTGEVSRYVVFSRDITERRRLEKEALRSSTLASLGELSAGVAHEINNPINGIINYARLILRKVRTGGPEAEIAQRIILEGNRIAKIVSSLLSFARESRGDRKTVFVGTVLADTMDLVDSLLKKDGIDVRVSLPPGLPPLLANPDQIRQVALNIITNARHALNAKYADTHEDKVLEIGASLQGEGEGKRWVTLSFKDHGVGIPEEVLSHVFDPFYTTREAGAGSGLGLSISHGIVAEHGGSISVTSKAGQYTEFRVVLPAAEEG